MKPLFVLLLLIIGTSCSNGDDDLPAAKPASSLVKTAELIPAPAPTSTPIPDSAPTDVVITFKADLKPATEVTYVTPYGYAILQFNQTAKTFKIMAESDNFNPDYGNIHTAYGKIVFVFPVAFFKTFSHTYSSVINDDQIMELMANHYYVNINGPDGDVNGQLIKQ